MSHRLSRNFMKSEFACSCCGEAEVDANLVYNLQKLRDAFGLPIHITSGYRCSSHNRAIGGSVNSQHLKGKAVDIRTSHLPGTEKHKLMTLIFRMNTFTGVGVGGNKLHVDVRDSDPVLWFY